MLNLFVLAVIVLSFVLMAKVVAMIFNRLNRWNLPFEHVNKRYQGQLFRGFLLSHPRLWFRYAGANVRVQNRKRFRRGSRVTELVVKWNDRRSLRFKITDRASGQNSASRPSQFGSSDRPVSMPVQQLHETYEIQTNYPDIMDRLLTPQVCWQIHQIASMSADGRLRISLRRGNLKIQRTDWCRSVDQLDDFIRYSLELFDRFRLADCEGIDFVNEEEVGVVEEAICPICSEKIDYEMVVCVRCKTPHCLDCWHYNGQCATFACDEKRYTRAG